ESARAVEPDPLQHILAAGVCLDRQRAVIDRLLQASGIALDDDERHALALQLLRDDGADPAIAADDEMICDRFQHALMATALQPLGHAAFDDDGGEERERVKRRTDAANQE